MGHYFLDINVYFMDKQQFLMSDYPVRYLHTVCPRSFVHYNIASCHFKMDKTSRTYSRKRSSPHYNEYLARVT